MKALELDHVSLAFRGMPVLEDVTFALDEGEFLGIIGPNGGGKSTLIKVVLGLLEPDEGKVRVFGKAPAHAGGEIAYVPQHPQFDRRFPIRVLDVVLMGRMGRSVMFKAFGSSDHDRAMTALRDVEAEALAGRDIGRLSGGELQRVLIARGLVADARLLLLDEPTASLDTRVVGSFYELLERLSAKMTIVLVSHDIGVMSQHVKSVACLNRKLYYHHSKEISREMVEEAYGCPVDFIVHSHSHVVLDEHEPHASG